LPGGPLGKRRAAPDSDSLKHRFSGDTEKTFRRGFSACLFARHKLPGAGKFCRAIAANISTLKKRRRAFVGKIPVKKRGYE
jgi:hypothetical protein